MNKRIYRKVLKRVIDKPVIGMGDTLTALEARVNKRHNNLFRIINAEVRAELEIEDEYYAYIGYMRLRRW